MALQDIRCFCQYVILADGENFPMVKTFQHMLLIIDMKICLLSSESSR